MTPIPLFDAHCDTVSACLEDGRSLRHNTGHLDLERLRRFSKAAQVFALFADRDAVSPGGMHDRCLRLRDTFFRELHENGDILSFCAGGKGVAKAVSDGKIAALLSIEGGELLDCDPEKLYAAKDWGVRCINLTWNHENALAGSHRDNPEKGLTTLGRTWVRRCEELDILVDVSHVSDRAFWDLVDITSKPILATHSNSRTLCPHSRNLTDDMFRAVCETGGAVGINLWLDFVGGAHSMDDILRHIDRFMELSGEKHLALGCDLDGCEALAGGIKGVEDLPLLWDALRAHGYDERTLEDLFFNNLLRVLAS